MDGTNFHTVCLAYDEDNLQRCYIGLILQQENRTWSLIPIKTKYMVSKV